MDDDDDDDDDRQRTSVYACVCVRIMHLHSLVARLIVHARKRAFAEHYISIAMLDQMHLHINAKITHTREPTHRSTVLRQTSRAIVMKRLPCGKL